MSTRTRVGPIRLLVADAAGRIYDHPELLMAGERGDGACEVDAAELIPLPRGSDLHALPGRRPIGIHPGTGEREVVSTWLGGEARAVSAFLSPAHTGCHLVAYERSEGAPVLPTYAYTAVGWADGAYWASAVRVDPDVRQEPWRFDPARIAAGVRKRKRELGSNRVVAQLETCANTYQCRAAQNFFLGRHEAPLPVSVACNAQCVGCISLQPDGEFRASHDRLSTAPSGAEVAAAALSHLSRVCDGIVSFGQGCEGEPLLLGDVLVDATRRIRAASEDGTINLNSNASRPDVVRRLMEAGLDSIRASLNSARPEVYEAYYNPRGYDLSSVIESLRIVHEAGGHTSINLLCFPGVTDTQAELEALTGLIGATGLDLVQMRNLNIDPDLYRTTLPRGAACGGSGMRWLMVSLAERFPKLRFGTFNPPARARMRR